MNPHHDFDDEYVATAMIRFLAVLVVIGFATLIFYNFTGV